MTDLNKKEPLPTKKTVFDFRITRKQYTASENKALKRIHHLLAPEYLPVMPTWLLSSQHIKSLGPAIWTLILIIRAGDWDTGIWKVRKKDLELWCDCTWKSIKNHFDRMEYLQVEWEHAENGFIEIFLPEQLIATAILENAQQNRKKFTKQRKVISTPLEKSLPEKRNVFPGLEPMTPTLNRIARRFTKQMGD